MAMSILYHYYKRWQVNGVRCTIYQPPLGGRELGVVRFGTLDLVWRCGRSSVMRLKESMKQERTGVQLH